MTSQWTELLASHTQGLRVAICQPEGSARIFLDIRRTYVFEEETRLSDEGLRFRVRDLAAITEAVTAILRGTSKSLTVDRLCLARQSRFLILSRTGKDQDPLKLFPCEVAFLRKALLDFAPQLETLLAMKEEEDDNAWAEFVNC